MKTQNSYTDNINKALGEYSRKAFAYRDAKAWDNRKAKAYKRIVPRGKVFKMLMNQEWQATTKPLIQLANELGIKYKLY